MSGLVIRDVSVDDAERLVQIYEHYVLNTAVSFEYDVPSADEFRNRIDSLSAKYPYLVCIKDDVIVGYAYAGAYFVSIITKASPLTQESWGLSNLMTSKALGEIGKIGCPRCCKIDSYLAILSAIDFVKEHFDVEMEKNKVVCVHSDINNQCIGSRCPFVQRAE